MLERARPCHGQGRAAAGASRAKICCSCHWQWKCESWQELEGKLVLFGTQGQNRAINDSGDWKFTPGRLQRAGPAFQAASSWFDLNGKTDLRSLLRFLMRPHWFSALLEEKTRGCLCCEGPSIPWDCSSSPGAAARLAPPDLPFCALPQSCFQRKTDTFPLPQSSLSDSFVLFQR